MRPSSEGPPGRRCGGRGGRGPRAPRRMRGRRGSGTGGTPRRLKGGGGGRHGRAPAPVPDKGYAVPTLGGNADKEPDKGIVGPVPFGGRGGGTTTEGGGRTEGAAGGRGVHDGGLRCIPHLGRGETGGALTSAPLRRIPRAFQEEGGKHTHTATVVNPPPKGASGNNCPLVVGPPFSQAPKLQGLRFAHLRGWARGESLGGPQETPDPRLGPNYPVGWTPPPREIKAPDRTERGDEGTGEEA